MPTSAGHVPEFEFEKLGSALRNLIKANPNLRTLSLDWPIGMQEALEEASLSLRNLQTLRVGNFPTMSAIAQVIRSNLGLKSLYLNNSMSSGQGNGDHNSVVLEFPVHDPETDTSFLTNLRELNLDGVGFLLSMVPLVSRFTNLTTLRLKPPSLSANMPFTRTDDVAAETLRSLTKLQVLEMPIVGNSPVLALAESCPDLQELDVIDGSQVNLHRFSCSLGDSGIHICCSCFDLI
jgi:hypothetical protein